MKQSNKNKDQLMLEKLKVEVNTLNVAKGTKRGISYPKQIKDSFKYLLAKGIKPVLISKITGIPVNTLYCRYTDSCKESNKEV